MYCHDQNEHFIYNFYVSLVQRFMNMYLPIYIFENMYKDASQISYVLHLMPLIGANCHCNKLNLNQYEDP